MSYRKVGYLEQLWYALKFAIKSHIEWEKMERWALEYHPAWAYLATESKDIAIRQRYKLMIMKEYRRIYGG